MPSTSKRARKANDEAFVSKLTKDIAKFKKDEKAIRDRYKDSGISGAGQMRKELDALKKKKDATVAKHSSKNATDNINVGNYGKDAMKSRGFARYNKGGMVKSNCGASMKPGQKRAK